MTDFSGLKAQMEEMGDELLADPSVEARVRAFLHMWKATQLLVAPLATIQRPAPSPARTSQPDPDVGIARTHSRGTGRIKRFIDPNRVAILEEAASVLRLLGGPMKTADIYESLGGIREKIGGTDRKGNLSAMMHHSPLFVSHGRGGWTLAEDRYDLSGATSLPSSTLRIEQRAPPQEGWADRSLSDDQVEEALRRQNG